MPSTPTVLPTELHPSAKGKTIFFTGITGYIGGTVLTRLLALPTPPAKITALMRDPKKAEMLKQLTLPSGTTLDTAIGSLSDLELITKGAEEHDMVIQTANADDTDMMGAIIEGMKRRKEKTGKKSILIETSGTGTLTDDAKGMHAGDLVYTDMDPKPATEHSPALLPVTELADNASHRPVDLMVVKADSEGILESYIILPSTIWGKGTGEIFDLGISNTMSQQIPNLIRAALDREQAGHVGKGINIWNHVNIEDIGDLFVLVYAGALSRNIGHGASGYYFGTPGEYTRAAAASIVGSTLVEKGYAKVAEPTTFTPEEIQKYYKGSSYDGTNSRGVNERSTSIGWSPRWTEMKDFEKNIGEEVDRVVERYGRKF